MDPDRVVALRPEEGIVSILERWLRHETFRPFFRAFIDLVYTDSLSYFGIVALEHVRRFQARSAADSARAARLESDLRQAQKELQEKQSQFTEEHPDVRAARTRLKLAQDKLKRTSEALTAAVPPSIAVTRLPTVSVAAFATV